MRRTTLTIVLILAVAGVLALAGCSKSVEPASSLTVSAQGAFTPSGPARAGVPLKLEFGQGGGCTAAVQFQELGIYEDLTDGGGTVSLPALEPGEYPLYCQSMMVMGVLTVQ